MPSLGKATYFLEINTRDFDTGMAKAEARAAVATDAIATQMGVASKSVQGLGQTTAATAGVVETSTGQMAMSFEETGAAAQTMGTQVEAGATKAATSSQAAAAKTAFAWEAASKKITGIGKRMRHIGKDLTMKATIPVAIIGGLAAKMSLDFSKAMTNIEALVGASAEQMKMYREEVLKLATHGPEAPKALAEALYFITSSGYEGARALKVLKASAAAATAGLGETSLIADVVTSAVTAYGEAALSAGRATDIMVGAVRLGKGEAKDLASVIGHVVAPAELLGIEFHELAGILASLSLVGVNFFEGATQMRGIMSALIKPSKAAKAIIDKLYGSTENLRKEIADNMVEGLIGLQAKLKGNKEALGKIFPNVRGFTGFVTALGKATGKTVAIQKELAGNIGETGRAAAIAAKSPLVRLQKAWSNLQVQMIKLGDIMVPVIVAIAEAVVKLVNAFQKLPKEVKIATILVIGLAAALGPLLSMIGIMVITIGALGPAFAGVLAFLLGPGALIAAIVALVAIMGLAVAFPDQFRAVLMKMGLSFEDASAAVDALATAFKALVIVVEYAANLVVALVKFSLDRITGYFDLIVGLLTGDWKQAWDGFVRIVKAPLELVKSLFSNFVNAIKDLFDSLWNGLKRTAFRAAAAIMEPFSHLPGRLGHWARVAKDKMLEELAKINAQEAAEAAENLAKQYGLALVPAFSQLGQDLNAVLMGELSGTALITVLPDRDLIATWNAKKGKWVNAAGKVIKDQAAAWAALAKKNPAIASVMTIKPGTQVSLAAAPAVTLPATTTKSTTGGPDGKGKEKGKKEKGPVFPGFSAFPAYLQLKELRASGTKWLGDDLKVMKLQMQYLMTIKNRLRKRGKLTLAKLLAIETEQQNIRDKVRDINEKIRDKMLIDLSGIPVGLRIRKTKAERTEALKDDIRVANQELSYWRNLRKQLIRKHAAQEDIADVEEKITETLLRRRDLMEQQKEAAEDINAAQRAAFAALNERAGFFGSFGSNVFTTAPAPPGGGVERTPGATNERGYAAGGVVAGRPGQDTVSARLTPGEGVLTRGTVTSIARDLGLQARTIEGGVPTTGERGKVTVEKFVNQQHFNAPTTDRHREARYAKVAIESVFDGVGAGEM